MYVLEFPSKSTAADDLHNRSQSDGLVGPVLVSDVRPALSLRAQVPLLIRFRSIMEGFGIVLLGELATLQVLRSELTPIRRLFLCVPPVRRILWRSQRRRNHDHHPRLAGGTLQRCAYRSAFWTLAQRNR